MLSPTHSIKHLNFIYLIWLFYNICDICSGETFILNSWSFLREHLSDGPAIFHDVPTSLQYFALIVETFISSQRFIEIVQQLFPVYASFESAVALPVMFFHVLQGHFYCHKQKWAKAGELGRIFPATSLAWPILPPFHWDPPGNVLPGDTHETYNLCAEPSASTHVRHCILLCSWYKHFAPFHFLGSKCKSIGQWKVIGMLFECAQFHLPWLFGQALCGCMIVAITCTRTGVFEEGTVRVKAPWAPRLHEP